MSSAMNKAVPDVDRVGNSSALDGTRGLSEVADAVKHVRQLGG
jgi:hypothetical protein